MGEVVSLDEMRPHLSGEALCLNCGNVHVAVAPVGVAWMECPECHLWRSTWRNQVERDGEHWHCDCGYSLFHLTPEGIYCPNCGEWQKGF
jgi:predicted RNA-binding Zn-ribbon protein involved in translation (DUF1610 family)